jgi:hypothetical protein
MTVGDVGLTVPLIMQNDGQRGDRIAMSFAAVRGSFRSLQLLIGC